MNNNRFYISVQYSAIQKTVLRHNRLWSIAGISQQLSRLNEIEFKKEVELRNGIVLVAGGGKFTAYFPDCENACSAKEAIVKKLSTTFPMLEFQEAGPVEARSLEGAKREHKLIDRLDEQKQGFRGYATSFLPHLSTCIECGEFPAEMSFDLKRPRGKLCRTCKDARESARLDFKNLNSIKQGLTSLERIYSEYLKNTPDACRLEPLYNFEDLFPDSDDSKKDSKRQRMAVWFSDVNNMNQKVPIWLAQKEDEILRTFETVKGVNIEIVGSALSKTFTKFGDKHLPFRLVVAGGDDLCIVMPEEYVLDFAINLDRAVRDKIKELDQDENNPLNLVWLKKQYDAWWEQNRKEQEGQDKKKEIGPYSFGSSFVITSIHTPFKRIHEVGEELMKQAKEKTNRLGNSINWRIMAEDEAVSDTILSFERPLFISNSDNSNHNLEKAGLDHQISLEDYMALREKFSNISSSHRFAIIARLMELRQKGRENEFEIWLKCFDSGNNKKDFSDLLSDKRLREDNKRQGRLMPERITTLFELLAIKKL